MGIPLLYAFLLFRARQQLATPSLLARANAGQQATVEQASDAWEETVSGHMLSFLLNGYKREYYWFEVVECYRRLFLSGFLVMIGR